MVRLWDWLKSDRGIEFIFDKIVLALVVGFIAYKVDSFQKRSEIEVNRRIAITEDVRKDTLQQLHAAVQTIEDIVPYTSRYPIPKKIPDSKKRELLLSATAKVYTSSVQVFLRISQYDLDWMNKSESFSSSIIDLKRLSEGILKASTNVDQEYFDNVVYDLRSKLSLLQKKLESASLELK